MKIHKKILLSLPLFVVLSVHSRSYMAHQGHPQETVQEAKDRFNCMSVSDIAHISICDLTPNQEQAFKELAESFFVDKVVRPNCFSQVNHLKYEVMYQKIGQLDYYNNKKGTI